MTGIQMAFTVEDGTVVAGANSYVSLAYANTHHTDRGNTAWTGADSAKQACLIRATDYVDKRFGLLFKGRRKSNDQSLEWPRVEAWRADGFEIPEMPDQLLKAVSEYALRAMLVGVLSPDGPSPVPAQSLVSGATRSNSVASGRLVEKETRVGPVHKTEKFQEALPYRQGPSSIVSAHLIPEYPEADMLLQLLLKIGDRTLVRG
jgi:hypothetical protein